MEARENMAKSTDVAGFAGVLARCAVVALLGFGAGGCAVETASEPGDDPGASAGGAGGKADGNGPAQKSIGTNVVVDCTTAKDGVSVRTCKLGSTDTCTVQATVQATQVVKNSTVVKAIAGASATHAGKAIYELNAAEAKLLANLKHMKLLLTSAGTPASTAYEYTKDGAPFVYASPISGMSLVTKTSANQSIARVAKALSASASTCSQFRVASTDGITPVDVAFICEKTSSDTLLFCDGTQPEGMDYAVGPSTIVNGVELNFVKAGCGAFGYDLVNKGDSAVSVSSKISGVALSPDCDFGVAAGGDGYCDAAGVAGPATLTYSGTITRGSTKASFSLPVMVRCTSL